MESIDKQYEKLGHRTLSLFILKRAPILLVILILLVLLLCFWNFIPIEYLNIVQLITIGLIGIFSFLGIVIVLLGFLEYKHYKIFINDETLKIYRGLISEEEIGIPLRRVKQVDIERSLIDQIWGVSNISLTIAGEEGGSTTNADKFLLTALDKKLAEEIQNIILKEAEVEEISVNPNK